MKNFVKSLVSKVSDIVQNPDKYRKGAVVPAAAVVYAVSMWFGADSQTTLEVIAVLATFGVYRVPNAA
jgi:hypothetical protein